MRPNNLPDSNSVQINDTIYAVMAVLQGNKVFYRAKVIAKVEIACRLDTRKHPWMEIRHLIILLILISLITQCVGFGKPRRACRRFKIAQYISAKSPRHKTG